MVKSLIERIAEVQIKSGIPKDIMAAAVNECPPSPAVTAWMAARIREALDADQAVDISTVERLVRKLAPEDELLSRRMSETKADIDQRVFRKLFDREIDRRLAEDSIIEVTLATGETGYERKEE